MFATRQQRAGVLTKRAFSTNGNGVKRCAVERIPHGNRLKSPGRGAGELECYADGRGAPRGEEDAAQVVGRMTRQPLGETDSGLVRVAARAKG